MSGGGDCLHLRKMGVGLPLRINAAGRLVLGTVSSNTNGGPPLGRGAAQSASRFSKENGIARAEMANGGRFFPDSEDGPRKFAPPKLSASFKAVASKDAGDASRSDANKIALELHLKQGHASARRLERISVDAAGGHQILLA